MTQGLQNTFADFNRKHMVCVAELTDPTRTTAPFIAQQVTVLIAYIEHSEQA
jgi:hypothetical protein